MKTRNSVEKLTLKQCYKLQQQIHKRILKLAEDRKENIKSAQLCRNHRTASVMPSGYAPADVGEILQIDGGCVLLKFDDGVQRWIEAIRLDPSGFDRPVTPFGRTGLGEEDPLKDAPVMVGSQACTIVKAGKHSVTVRALAPVGPPFTIGLHELSVLKES